MSATAPVAGGRPHRDVVQVFEPNAFEFPELRTYLSELAARRPFIIELARSEVRGQRSSTFLGELWSLVDPLFQALTYWFLFTIIRGGASGRTTEFVTAIIGSAFFFNYTRVSIGEGGRAILRHKGLVLNAVFPRAVLVLAEVYKGFLSTVPALALYVVIHTLMGAPVGQSILLLPLLLLIQTVLNLGLALLLSTATAYFMDVSNLLNYVLRLLTVATPIMYPVSLLSPSIRQFLVWNPLFALFSCYQAVITGVMPETGQILQSIGWAALLSVAGAWVFLRHERSFALHI